MYNKILVGLDHSPADDAVLTHVSALARLTGGEVLLLHVATGWAAQWREEFRLEDTREMEEDRTYVAAAATRLRAEGIPVRPLTARGDAALEILRLARSEGCDLIAMTTHGHGFVVDVLVGSTIEKVRHETDIPILVVRGAPRKA